ncbi:Aste57867_5822 [Aphanomyces stellatus]|uniref:Aste57867_5822 protein n=1 Tax=Aphanomyces stellatus TaxID=120398 RepID=A0A485KGW4_9STRA|nr:hypothetical protein As57867_005808 [Aphanomyces stellatus]VFT82845.1 Aste57867_5822 [Aphanomyces stellatus]
MSLEYLLDVAIQIEHPNFPQEYLDRHEDPAALSPIHGGGSDGMTALRDATSSGNHKDGCDDDDDDDALAPAVLESLLRDHERNGGGYGDDDDFDGVKVECNDETSMLKPSYRKFSTALYRKAEAARRRRRAIERRNARRNIVPKQADDEVDTTATPVCIDRNKTKNRISAASYRENRDKRVSFIQNEIKQLQHEFPHIQSKPWTPMKKPKSAMRDGESKEEYRKRTNRESAADSRFQQQQKLQYLTRELARLRALAQHHRVHKE